MDWMRQHIPAGITPKELQDLCTQIASLLEQTFDHCACCDQDYVRCGSCVIEHICEKLASAVESCHNALARRASGDDAENEGKIMQQVGGSSSRIPDLIAIETVPNASGANIVRLAMTKVPGESLGSFLNHWKQQSGRAPVSNPQVMFNQLAEACNWSRELLSQLVPAFEVISPRAFHRDVNTHNVLVSSPGDLSAPQFGLIDFGLAIEAQSWASLSTQVPVVGDCRYWPVSAWFIFAAGGPEIIKQPQLLMEYRTQLDLHALGVTALQLFIEMLPQPVAGSAAASMLPEEFRVLKRAWEHYWQDAYRFWEPLFHAFERKTDWLQLRQRYLINNVHLIIAESLGNLRQALSNACDACARADPGSHLSAARPLFAALLELISQGGKGLAGEVGPCAVKVTSWQTIRSILAGRRGSGTSRRAVPDGVATGGATSHRSVQLPVGGPTFGTTTTIDQCNYTVGGATSHRSVQLPVGGPSFGTTTTTPPPTSTTSKPSFLSHQPALLGTTTPMPSSFPMPSTLFATSTPGMCSYAAPAGIAPLPLLSSVAQPRVMFVA